MFMDLLNFEHPSVLLFFFTFFLNWGNTDGLKYYKSTEVDHELWDQWFTNCGTYHVVEHTKTESFDKINTPILV